MNFINTGCDKSTTEYLKKSVGDFETRVIKISGNSDTLDKLEKMIAYMESLGNIGYSTSFKVFVDGDGAFNIQTKSEDGEKLSKKWWDELSSPKEDKDIESFDFS